MHRTTWISALLLTLALVASAPGNAHADGPPVAPPVAPPAGAPAAPEASAPLTKEELETLVGPIALYPDVLLSSLLPATAAPLDVVAAARAVEQAGGKLAAVPAGTNWDPSVQALLQFPDVLLWMNQNLEWVKQMGYAVATQQADVLGAIQEFRRKAQAAGNLKSDEHMTVTNEDAPVAPGAPADAPPAEVICIQPTDPTVVYVPYYVPSEVVVSGYAGWGWGWGFSVGLLGAWAFHDIFWGWPYYGYYGWHGYYGHYHGGGIYYSPYYHHHGAVHNVGVRRPSAWQASRHVASRRPSSVTSPSSARHAATGTRGLRTTSGVQPPSRSNVGTRQPLWTRTSTPPNVAAPNVAGSTRVGVTRGPATGTTTVRSGTTRVTGSRYAGAGGGSLRYNGGAGTRYGGTHVSGTRSVRTAPSTMAPGARGASGVTTRSATGWSATRPAGVRYGGFGGVTHGSVTNQMSSRGGSSIRSSSGGSSFSGYSGRSMGSGFSSGGGRSGGFSHGGSRSGGGGHRR